MKGTDVNSLEVWKLVGEYDFVAKQLYQVKDANPLLLDIAKGYQESEQLARGVDSVYGSEAAKYMTCKGCGSAKPGADFGLESYSGEAIEAFYSRS